MKYELINGKNIINEIALIKKTLDETSDTVFIYTGGDRICYYIDSLTEDEDNVLGEDYLYKFKICYEKKDLNLSVTIKGNTKKVISISELIGLLDKDTPVRIVIENDSREELAFVVQQLIYIQYPLGEKNINVLLKKEESEADKLNRFKENLIPLIKGCYTARLKLNELRKDVEKETDQDVRENCLKDVDTAIKSCQEIAKKLDKASSVELKFAVAASKKTGKSVMVNCFLGEEIAPTDNQLATPNNCVYRISKDGLYHLEHDGKKDDRTFNTRKEAYEAIRKEFKDAEKNVKDGFLTLDMNIRYPTDKNNFSSYTIYDTPGPDAAGTKHREAAYNALYNCDVAIFAMDYSKYLTDNEEAYLREVKQTFQKLDKFHSLLFALNKLDVRYNDANTSKSVVKLVDFIKKRLSDIDKSYGDCIIFPTCSLEYFYAIDSKNSGANELVDEVPIDDMGRIRNSHKDIKCLQWLNTLSSNLSYYHGFKTISYDIFKKDSGMPALMNYVSYIANNKAREEILNNVTYNIDIQKQNLQVIINYISNLEKFINMGDDKINKITQIIQNYKEGTAKILNPDFIEEDLNILESDAQLRQKNGSYKEIEKEQKKAVIATLKNETIVDEIYKSIVKAIYDKIPKSKRLDNESIRRLFGENDFAEVVNSCLRMMARSCAGDTYRVISKVCSEITIIIERRQKILSELSDKCRIELEKENMFLTWPELPSFKPATSNPPIGDMKIDNINLNFDIAEKIQDAFSVSFGGSLETLRNVVENIERLWNKKTDLESLVVKDVVSKEKFIKICNKNLKDKCRASLYDIEIPEHFKEEIVKVVIENYLNNIFKELDSFFKNMNEIYLNSVNQFTEAIDDRQKYLADNLKYLKRKKVISSITDSTSDFRKIWNEIVGEIACTN